MRCCPRDLQQIYLSVSLINGRRNCYLACKPRRSYPEILELHVGNLTSILTEVGSGEVQDQLDERLRAFAEGEIDHASEAFSSLWKVLTSSRSGEVFRPSSVRLPSFRGRLILIPISA